MTIFIGGIGLSSVAVRGGSPTLSGIPVPLNTVDINGFIAQFPTGSEFRFVAGTYRFLESLVARSGDIYHGTVSGGVRQTTITGAKILTGWVFESGRWWVGGQTQQGTVGSSSACAGAISFDPEYPMCIHPEALFMDDVFKIHVSTIGEVIPGTWHFDYPNDRIYVGDDPNGHLVETSWVPKVFAPTSSASNVTISDMIIEKFAAPTAEAAVNLGYSPLGAANWTCESCEVRYCSGGGIGNDAFTSARNNYVHHNIGFGFIGAGEGVVIEGNEIAYNNIQRVYNRFFGAGGSKWVFTTGLIVRNNNSHHNWGPGLWTDTSNIDTLYENNVVEFNQSSGIFHEISYDAIIRNNTCRFNGQGQDFPFWVSPAGIEVVSSRNVEVYDNVLEGNYNEITGNDDGRTGAGDPNAIHGLWQLTGFNVHHNNITNTTIGLGGARSGVIGAFPFTWDFNNHVYGPAVAEPFFITNDSYNETTWVNVAGKDVNGSFTRVP
jgi:hypothetical protein